MTDPLIIGWREWVGLPGLNIARIKAKIDTGAKTSALHAYRVKPFSRDGQDWVRFYAHPVQKQSRPEIACEARLADRRPVRSSNGKTERRFVITTMLDLGGRQKMIELTLTNRDEMGFRMLIGRQALGGLALVDSAASFALGDEVTYP